MHISPANFPDMRSHIKKQLLIGLIFTLVILSGLGIYAYVSIGRLIDTAVSLTQASRIVSSAERLLVISIDIETGMRGYVITGDESYLAPYDSARQVLNTDINALLMNTRSKPLQNERVKEIQSLIAERVKLASDIIEARKQGFEQARQLVQSGEGKAKMDEIRTLVNQIQETERIQFRQQNRISGNSLVQFQYAFISLLVISGIVVMISFFILNKHLNARDKVEHNLREASAEISELNKELEGYTYSVSHDLRAPLRSIAGYSQVLKEDYADKLDQEGNRVIDVVIRNAKQMGQLIDDLLHFSRVGRKEVSQVYCNMDEMVQNAIDELIAHDPSKRSVITVRALDPAHADASMLKQVWVNLIANAIKYSSKKPDPRIEIGSSQHDGEVCYFVKDNGVGFNMAYKDKLFGVFQRLHKSNEFEGTGVGLALVKRIVGRHGGRIWAEAQLNEGATFYFTLPKNQ